eukprot:scaffold4147_cov114-Skeletonema_dohrnii-CCMP3373.AAC.2
MPSPRSSHCLLSAALIIISTLVDAFTVPATVRAIPSEANAIINHYRHERKNLNFPHKQEMIITLNSSSNNSEEVRTDSFSSNSLFDGATTVIGKSASSLVSLSFFLLLSTQRDAITTTLFIGSILNAISGKILKKIINHDRPAELELSDRVKLKPSDGGMPSSHAMSLSFIGTVILLGVIVPATTAASGGGSSIMSITGGALMVIYSAIALRYRVRDHLHTLDQIIVGYGFGLFNAIVWLKFAVNNNDGADGPVVSMVQKYLISSETNQFPLVGLLVPILVGILVVGSFERRIGVWLKERNGGGGEDKMK